MRKTSLFFLCLLFLLSACQSPNSTDSKSGSDTTQIQPEDVERLVQEAYFHCFPIVENYKAMYAYAIDSSSPKYLPMNTPYNTAVLYSPADKFVVSPNNDTYYTTATLDLRAEPIIIKVPAITDRYYSFQLNSMVTDNFGYIGTNSTGTKEGTYAITSPGFSGKLPDGVTEIKSPSDLVGLIGRTAVNAGDPADIKKAKEVQGKYQIGVMHKYYPDFPPKQVPVIHFPKFKEQDKSDQAFFSLLNFLLQYIKTQCG